ncbi:MAG: glycosyltransferase family 9 protein [Endomicrobia bacterium]|nr:glycosyltransferase family 9 protein [Endomicrobiia bacterium]
MNKTKKLKILTTNVLHIGDFILTTSALAILKKTYPDSEITVIAPKSVQKLVENNPVIDNVHYCPYPEYNFKSQIKRLFWIIFNWPALFFKRYDYCVILDSSRLSIITAKLLFVKIYGIDKNFSGLNISPEIQKYYGILHNINRSQMIIKSAFGIYNNALPVSPDYLPYVKKTERLIKDKKKTNIALCLRGAGDKRGAGSEYGIHSQWALDNFIKTINIISENRDDIDFYIVGVKNDYEYAEKAVLAAAKKNVANLCGKTSVLELIAFISSVSLLISVDTGTTHCAALTKTHIIVLRPDADYIAPVTPRLTEISGEKLSLVTPEIVSGAANKILDGLENNSGEI